MNADGDTYRDSNLKTLHLLITTVVWVATLAVARFGPEALWNAQQLPVASWIAIAVNLVAGAVWIVAFLRFLRALDDLQRKIMQDAFAITLGVGWVMGFAWVVADNAGLLPDSVTIAMGPGILAVVFLTAFVVGKFRYR